MIASNAGEWMVEIRADERARDKIIDKGSEMVRGFHGSGYSGEEDGADNPENHAFKMVSSILPLLAYSNPKATVGSQKHGAAQEWSKALQHGLNRWITLTRWHRLSEKLATDYCFTWGATLTSVQVRPGFEEAEDPPMWPQVARLSPTQFGFDRLAYSFEEARYVWHKVVIDKDRLIEMAQADAELPEDEQEGWSVEGCRAIAQAVGIGALRPGEEVREDEVSYYEIWESNAKPVVEENTAELGYHGVIHRFSQAGEGTGVEICKSFDYWGPRWGPYTLYGCFQVPDKPWPLSVLMATYTQEKELNDIARSSQVAAKNYKRAFFADDEDLVTLMQSSEHENVYFHPNLMASKVETAEFGGITDQMIAQEARQRDALERNSGLTEIETGNVTGGTATEASYVTGAANKRQSYYVRKFADATRSSLMTVLWFLANHDGIVYELGEDAAAELGMQQPEFQGGPALEDVGTLDELELEVDVRSMGHRSFQEEGQDAMNKLQIVAELANLAVTSPVRVQLLAEQIGEKMGWPDLAELIDLEQAAVMREQMQQAAAGGEGGGKGPQQFTPPPQPRLGITTTAGASGRSQGRQRQNTAPKAMGKPMSKGAA